MTLTPKLLAAPINEVHVVMATVANASCCQVTLCQIAYLEEGVKYPEKSFTIHSIDGIARLHAFLSQVIAEFEKMNPPNV